MTNMRISLAIPLALILAIGTTACAGREITGSPTTGSFAAAGPTQPTGQRSTQPMRTQAPSTGIPIPESTTENPSNTSAPPPETSQRDTAPTETPPPDVAFVPDPGTTPPPADSPTSDVLAPFFAAADTADAALAAAAAAVNDSYTGDQMTFTQATADLLNQARPSAVAAVIPAGLDPETERAVLLVYSDLESRFAALHGESCVQVGTYTRAELDPHCFTEGHAAVVAMPTDVAAARSTASSASAFTDAGPHSREAAEVALRVGYVDGNNEGCGSHGGFRATDPIEIVWSGDPSAVDGAASAQGLTNGVGFTVSWAGDTWSVRYQAC